MRSGGDSYPVTGRAGVAAGIEAVHLLDGVPVPVRPGDQTLGQHVILKRKF